MPFSITSFFRRLKCGTPEHPRAMPKAPKPAPKNTFPIGRQIIDFEARRDSDGDVIAYDLPSNDGGGKLEFAGINDRYHPEAVEALQAMHKSRREAYAAEYIESYTLKMTGLSKVRELIRPGTLFFVLDMTFNRGPGGSAWMVQAACQALGMSIVRDGKWGPATRAALIDADERFANYIIPTFRKVREEYETVKVGRRENFWRGLANRWNKCAEVANELNG